ncbi:CBS domain protein [compost metagenome]
MSNSDRPLRGRVRDVMTTQVATVSEAMPIALVIKLMLDTGHHHLPVAADSGTLRGMVTQADLIAALFGADTKDLAQIA